MMKNCKIKEREFILNGKKIKSKSLIASLKPTKYKCLDCKTMLQELAPEEYFRCPQCDMIFNIEQVK